MKLMMTFFYTMLFFLFSNSKEVFFENINVGDDLETCLANGSVQYQTNSNVLELASDNIAMDYFTFNEVQFDENHIIKEIKFTFHQNDKTNKTAQEVSNSMIEYFCQHYQGMEIKEIHKEEKVEEYKANEIKVIKKGRKNSWQTNKINITLLSYSRSIMDRTKVYQLLNGEPFDPTAWLMWLGLDYDEGDWVELQIQAK